MKHIVLSVALGLAVALAAPAIEVAADSDSGSGSGWTPTAGTLTRGVPELDATVAGSAMVLLLGGVAYIASRRRKDD